MTGISFKVKSGSEYVGINRLVTPMFGYNIGDVELGGKVLQVDEFRSEDIANKMKGENVICRL